MYDKRINIILGHYGSGKTNIALNMAYLLRERFEKVAIADLDIVNPYFRTSDSAEELRMRCIRLIASGYAGSNVDAPAMPAEIYSITDDKETRFVLDIGGDDRGAYALGRLSKAIVAENDYNCYLVINRFRPLTRNAEEIKEVLDEITAAGHIPVNGIINNSNIGIETTAEDIRSSGQFAKDVEEKTGIAVKYTTVREDLYEELKEEIPNLIPLRLQKGVLYFEEQ